MIESSDRDIVVYRNQLLDRVVAVLMIIGIYALSGTLAQSFEIYVPGFSETDYPLGWASRIFYLLILISIVKDAPSTFKNVTERKIVLVVNSVGLSGPNITSLNWQEISRISNSFGWIKFFAKTSAVSGFELWEPGLNRNQWRKAKHRIRVALSDEVEVKF